MSFGADVMARLVSHDWQGNVRQLRNFIERLAVFADGERITVEDVERHLGAGERRGTVNALAEDLLGLGLSDPLKRVEGALVAAAVRRCGGNKSAAGRLLGRHRKFVERRLAESPL